MKYFKKIFLLLVFCLYCLGISSCSFGTKPQDTTEDKQKQIYKLAQDSGFDGTYEEWLESIKGVDGTSITNVMINSDGELILTLSNGRVQNCGKIKGDAGEGITSIDKTSTSGLVDTYTIKYSNGKTTTFTVTNGKDGIQGIQGIPGNDGHTPVITIVEGYWYVDGTNTFVLATGLKGDTGNGISSISKTSTSGLVDTYTITFTNNTTTTFTVTNGKDGIQGIQGIPGNDGHTPVITIVDGYWYVDGANTNVLARGLKGDTGNGISSISKTSTSGLVDTYTISYTDGTTTTFTVTNGKDGIQGIQGVPGNDGHTPVITIVEGYWYVDGTNTNVLATGLKGDTGNGISSISKTSTSGLVDTYTISYTDGTTTTFDVTNGATGEDGVGISSININEEGQLVVQYTNNTSSILGRVEGKDGVNGNDGKGILDIVINDQGQLVLTFTDNTTKNLGQIVQMHEDEVFNVTFKDNDVVLKEARFTKGSFIEYLSVTDKPNFEFLGWYLGNDKWRFNIDVINKDVVLEAKWLQTVEEIEPVYQGMTAESLNDTALRLGRLSIPNVVNNKNMKIAIDEFLSIESEADIEYYAEKGEKFNIIVHIYNPTCYEILSFTLNGYKYQSYEFKEGSNSTQLIVEVDPGKVSGLKEFTIDAIKYVDKTKIKDVKLEGKRTVKVGVKYDVTPTASVVLDEVSSSSYKSEVDVIDDTSLIQDPNGLFMFIYDGETLVKQEPLVLGRNSIDLTGLKMGYEYELMIVGVYDDYSGTGKQVHNLYYKKFTTLEGYVIKDIVTTKTSISASLDKKNILAEVVKVNLLLNDTIICTINNSEEIVFGNLLSNTNYKLEVIYQYNLLGTTFINSITEEVKTHELVTPIVDFTSITPDNNSVNYSLSIVDNDNTLVSNEVKVYLNDTLVTSSNKTTDTFNNLLSNNTYRIVLTYTYNLNDGTGDFTKTITDEFSTNEYVIPKLDIIRKYTDSEISIITVLNDPDNIIRVDSIVLVDNLDKEFIKQSDTEYKVSNLLSNKTYQVRITYSYDLLDGSGVQTYTKELDITTLKQVPTISVEALLTDSHSTLIDIETIDNNQTGSIDKVILYKNDKPIKVLSNTQTLIEELNSNTLYKVVVTYRYDLNDGLGSKTIEASTTFTTLKEMPNVELNVTASKQAIALNPIITDIDNSGSITKVEIYLQNTLLETKTENFTFDNLLSNTKYTFKLYYEYNLNEEDEVLVITKDVITNNLETPTVDVELTSTNNTITYNVVYVDNESILTIKEVVLLKGEIVQTNNTNFQDTFNNLLSNTTYTVKVNYEYDLNDGQGLQSVNYSKTIKTKSLTIPTIGIKVDTITDALVTGSIVKTDIDNVCVIDSISLYSQNNLVSTSLDETFSYNVLPNVTYMIKVAYHYDLLDGMGVQNKEYEYTLTSLKQTPTISISAYNIKQTEMNYTLMLTDPNSTGHVSMISLYEGLNLIRNLDEHTTSLQNLTPNTEYTIQVNYIYDFDDGLGSREITEEYKFKTLKSVPTYSIENTVIGKNNIEFTHNVIDTDNALTFISAELLLNGIVVNTIDSIENTKFENLLSDTTYQLVVTFNRNLNNGDEIITTSKTCKTLPLEKPIVNITIEATKTSITYSYTITDNDSVATINAVKLYLDELVVDVTPDNNTYSNLYSDVRYKLVIELLTNYNNGVAPQIETFEKEITTLSLEDTIFDFTLDKTKDSISYDHTITDIDNVTTIKEVRLYLGDVLVSTNSLEDPKVFTNLYSDTTYKVVYVLEKDFRNNQNIVTELVEKEIKTVALTNPTFDFTLDKTKDSITYDHTITDIDNVTTIKEVRLYLGDVLVSTNSLEDPKVFTNLYSDTTYKVVYVLEKDFRNNQNIVTELVEKEIKTEALIVPVVNFELASSQESITYSQVLVDPDNLFVMNKIDVYRNNILVKTITDFTTNTISELESNVLYKLVFEYQYDLNNNTEVTKVTKTYQYSTLAYDVEITNYELINNLAPKTNEDVMIRFDLNNRSKTRVNYIIVNGNRYNITGGDFINSIIITFKAPKVSGTYTLDVQKFGYTLNNVNVEQNITTSTSITYEVLSRLDIVKISSVNGSGLYKNYYGLGYVITIDNPNGYTVKDYNNSYPVYKIDNNHWYAPSLPKSSFTINSVTYIDEQGNTAVRRYSDYQNYHLTYINPDTNTNALIVQPIYTAEEFINMESGKAYELMNDIDLINYEWTPKSFNGYFNGNGHTISNLTYTYESEINSSYYVSIYSSVTGTFKNVFFDNVFINFDVPARTYSTSFNILGGYPEGVSSVLFRGSVNVPSWTNLNYNMHNGEYIVDYLYVNNKNVTTSNVITHDTFNSTEFKTNTLNWVFNQKETLEIDGLRYSIIDNAYIMIEGYTGTNTNLVIPTEINGLKVIGIEDLAFENNTTIKSITIPNTVKALGRAIFSGCSNLESISIDTLFTINELQTLFSKLSYDNTTKNESGYYIPNTLKSIEINKTLCGIINFRGLEILTNIKIPDGTERIDDYSFSDFIKLTSITIPSSVTSIGSYAFSECSNLISITIPNSVTSIGGSAFYGCSNLTSITIPNSVTSIGSYAFYGCSNLTSITIPNSVTSIGGSAFSGCSNLTSITIPSSVTSIGSYAFSECSNLISITIPNSVTSIGGSAFSGCSNLTSITIPNSVTSIGSYAFSGCSNLTSITLPESLESIDTQAFIGCYMINNLYYNGTIEKWLEIKFGESYSNPLPLSKNTYFKNDSKEYYDIKTIKHINIPEGITDIGNYQFEGFNNTIVSLPNSVTNIGNSAFGSNVKYVVYNGTEEDKANITIGSNNDSLQNALWLYSTDNPEVLSNETFKYIQYGNNVILFEYLSNSNELDLSTYFSSDLNITIVPCLFKDQINLTNVIIPSSVTSIPLGAFSGCYNLESITLPFVGDSIKSSTDTYQYPFGCIFGTSSYDNSTKTQQYYNGSSTTSSSSSYYYIPNSLKTVTITGGNINYGAFYNCNNLTSITIPESVTSIGQSAFYDCSNLTSITIPDSVTSIGEYAFNGCDRLTSIKIPDGVEIIQSRTFSNCTNLSSIILPSSLLAIRDNAFSDCYSLVEIYNLSNLDIQTNNSSNGYIGYYAKVIHTDINTPSCIIRTEDGFEFVKDSNNKYYLFNYTGTSSDIVLPEYINGNIYEINKYAFANKTNIVNLTIPNTITSIGSYAFSRCTNLTSITIPSSVTTIGYYALSYCKNLIIYCEAPSKPSGWSSYWNSDCPVVWGYTPNE